MTCIITSNNLFITLSRSSLTKYQSANRSLDSYINVAAYYGKENPVTCKLVTK